MKTEMEIPKENSQEVIGLPQEVMDFINEFNHLSIMDVLRELSRGNGCLPYHLKVYTYVHASRDNQINFVKAWTGEYELVLKKTRYGIKNMDIGKFVKSYEVSKRGVKKEFSNDGYVELFDEEKEAKLFAELLKFSDGEEYIIVPL